MLKLVPSNAPRWAPCPGSVGMEAPFPRSPTHPVTEEGKALHWACERVLRSWLPVNDFPPLDLHTFLGQICPENGIVITEEMIWAGGVYLETVWERVWQNPELLQVEKQLSADRWISGYNGRTDAMWRSPDSTWLSVYDLKFGYTPTATVGNWQLLSYALGAVTEQTQTVEMVIVQPRGVSASRPVKRWQLPIAEFWQWAQQLIDAAVEARGPSPRTAAGGHCYKCKAAADCPTLRVAAAGAMDTGSAGVDVALTEPELAHEIELLDRAKALVRARLDACEALGVARIQAGRLVPGYSHEQGLSNRSWTLPAPQMIAMGELWGLDLAEHKPLSPNQAEGRGMPRDVIDRFTKRVPTAAKLVRVDRNEAREIFQR